MGKISGQIYLSLTDMALAYAYMDCRTDLPGLPCELHVVALTKNTPTDLPKLVFGMQGSFSAQQPALYMCSLTIKYPDRFTAWLRIARTDLPTS